jgi:hypothetical protein
MILEVPREVKGKVRPFGHRRNTSLPTAPLPRVGHPAPAPVFLFLASSQFPGQADRPARRSSFLKPVAVLQPGWSQHRHGALAALVPVAPPKWLHCGPPLTEKAVACHVF